MQLTTFQKLPIILDLKSLHTLYGFSKSKLQRHQKNTETVKCNFGHYSIVFGYQQGEKLAHLCTIN